MFGQGIGVKRTNRQKAEEERKKKRRTKNSPRLWRVKKHMIMTNWPYVYSTSK